MTEIQISEEQSLKDYQEFKSLMNLDLDDIYRFVSNVRGMSISEVCDKVECIKSEVKKMTKQELGSRHPYDLFFGRVRDLVQDSMAHTIHMIFYMKMSIKDTLDMRNRRNELSEFFRSEKVSSGHDPYEKTPGYRVVDIRRKNLETEKFMSVPGAGVSATYWLYD